MTSALTYTGNALLRALTYTAERLVSTLADLADRLASAFPDLADRLAGTLADVPHRALGSFADILDCLASLTDEMASALAHLFGCVANPFEQLRIAIERGQYPLENQGDVVEPRLQQSLGLDALDLQLHFAQACLGTYADLHQVAHLRQNRHLRSQVLNLDVDFINLDDGNI